MPPRKNWTDRGTGVGKRPRDGSLISGVPGKLTLSSSCEKALKTCGLHLRQKCAPVVIGLLAGITIMSVLSRTSVSDAGLWLPRHNGIQSSCQIYGV